MANNCSITIVLLTSTKCLELGNLNIQRSLSVAVAE
jgi:hypothetical protein